MNTHELKITRTIKAPRAAVYKAFTEKAELLKWFCPEQMTLTFDELDVKVGGSFLLHMKDDKDGSVHTARGTYKEVQAPEKLVFSWQWTPDQMGDGKETLITVLFYENTSGNTELEFIHSQFAEEKFRDMHQKGWSSAFNKFDRLEW